MSTRGGWGPDPHWHSKHAPERGNRVVGIPAVERLDVTCCSRPSLADPGRDTGTAGRGRLSPASEDALPAAVSQVAATVGLLDRVAEVGGGVVPPTPVVAVRPQREAQRPFRGVPRRSR